MKSDDIPGLVSNLKSKIASTKVKLSILKAQKRTKIMKANSKGKRSSSLRSTFQYAISDLDFDASLAADDEDEPTIDHSLLPARADLSITDFEAGAQLGRGKFGQVYLARHRTTNYICALKIITKSQIADDEEENLIRRELEVHQNLAHPNILRFLSWFHDDAKIYLVLEYAPGGNLFKLLKAQPKNRFNERVAAQYIAQMAEALRYLHNKNVMHRDIKPENILLGLHNEIKLADFGYSVHSVSGFRSTVCGTLDYLPPEIARIMLAKPTAKGEEKERYTKAVDHWSLGVLTYELLTGKPPFEMKSRKATEKKIAEFKGKVKFPAYVGEAARDFILKLLNLDADGRLSLEEVLRHPWIDEHCEKSAMSGLRSFQHLMKRAGME